MNIGYLVLSILRWLLYAPVGVCANIVVWLTCWLLPVFSFFTDDGQLPRCLRWAQTHDNSLDSLWAGSEGAKHRANNSYPWLYQYSNEQIAQSYILRYLARMFWLIRNPAYGFAHDVLGFSDRNAERIYGREYYGGTKYVYDSGRGWWNRYAWTYRRDIPLFGKRYLRIYIGFKAVSTYETSPNLILATHINPFRKQ